MKSFLFALGLCVTPAVSPTNINTKTVAASGLITEIICEDNTYIVCDGCVCGNSGPFSIDCGVAAATVTYVNYGRTSQAVCVDTTCGKTQASAGANLACYMTPSFIQPFKDNCNDGSCTYLARNSVFNDGCEGTYKYLEVQYYCGPCIDDSPDGTDTGCNAVQPFCVEDGGSRTCVECVDDSSCPSFGIDSGCDADQPFCVEVGEERTCLQCEDTSDCLNFPDFEGFDLACLACTDNICLQLGDGAPCNLTPDFGCTNNAENPFFCVNADSVDDGQCVPCITDENTGATDAGCSDAQPFCVGTGDARTCVECRQDHDDDCNDQDDCTTDSCSLGACSNVPPGTCDINVDCVGQWEWVYVVSTPQAGTGAVCDTSLPPSPSGSADSPSGSADSPSGSPSESAGAAGISKRTGKSEGETSSAASSSTSSTSRGSNSRASSIGAGAVVLLVGGGFLLHRKRTRDSTQTSATTSDTTFVSDTEVVVSS